MIYQIILLGALYLEGMLFSKIQMYKPLRLQRWNRIVHVTRKLGNSNYLSAFRVQSVPPFCFQTYKPTAGALHLPPHVRRRTVARELPILVPIVLSLLLANAVGPWLSSITSRCSRKDSALLPRSFSGAGRPNSREWRKSRLKTCQGQLREAKKIGDENGYPPRVWAELGWVCGRGLRY